MMTMPQCMTVLAVLHDIGILKLISGVLNVKNYTVDGLDILGRVAHCVGMCLFMCVCLCVIHLFQNGHACFSNCMMACLLLIICQTITHLLDLSRTYCIWQSILYLCKKVEALFC